MATARTSTLHAHGCSKCRARYEDTCGVNDRDGLCPECRRGPGSGWQLLIRNRNPKDCCRLAARLTTAEERKRYSLVGTSAWFICPTCSRTHPFDPKDKTL